MATVLFTAATMAELPLAQNMIASAQQCFAQSESIIYVLDCKGEVPQIEGAQCVDAAQLLPDTYTDEAFFFNKDELRMRVAVLAAYKLCCEENETIFAVPQYTFAGICRPALPKNTLIGLCNKTDTQLPGVTIGLIDIDRISPDIMLFGKGEKMQAYLKWCADKMTWISGSARLPYAHGLVEELDVAEMQRSFMTKFPQYAHALGCSVMRKTLKELGAHLASEDEIAEASKEYGYSHFDDGMPVFDFLRDYYGLDCRLRENCKGNPFAHSELFTQVSALTGDAHIVPVPPAAAAFYKRRSDIFSIFTEPFGKDREAFVKWYCDYGSKEKGIDEKWVQPIREKLDAYAAKNTANDALYRSLGYRIKKKLGLIRNKKPQAANYPFGVNLCGFIKGDFGLGEATRILADILDAGEVPFTVIDFQGAPQHTYNNEAWAGKISNEFKYGINLMLTNADGLPTFLKTVAPEAVSDKYNIGFWYWEFPEFPEEQKASVNLIDEIWTASDFNAEAYKSFANGKPITVIPCSISPKCDDALTRADFGIPEGRFTFLAMYDVRSWQDRKNPRASIDAFLKAFGGRDDVMLVLKLNVSSYCDEVAEVEQLIDGHSNIMILLGTYPRQKVNSLLKLCDAFISLHRAEGFGLAPAEAMYYGRPAVLTNYSGNTQYMTDDNCCAVRCDVTTVKKDWGPYKKGWHWAEPDVDDAAEKMKKLVDDKAYYKKLSQNAEKTIREKFSAKAIGKTARARLEAIENEISSNKKGKK